MAGSNKALRVAVEGCGHGTLDAIYASIEESCKVNGWDGVDLVIIGGDFQAVRNRQDLNVTAMPEKYRRMGDFHQYYYGAKVAPYLTVFVGGNHEASNYLFELYYGGWVAPNIYYLGAANVLQVGPLKLAGLSGIWHKHDSRKPHFERLPYNSSTMRSIYHVRDLDARKLLAYRNQVDIGLSHDWPQGIEWLGDYHALFRAKPFFRPDAEKGELGNVAARKIMNRLRPPYWFSAHLHWKYTAFKTYEEDETNDENTVAPKPLVEGTRTNGISHDNPNEEPLGHRPRTFPIRSSDQDAVSAWNNFHVDSKKEEADESAKLIEESRTRQEEANRIERPMQSPYAFEETYKEVQVEGMNRHVIDKQAAIAQPLQESEPFGVPQFDGNFCSLPRKRPRDSSPSEQALAQPLIDGDDANAAVLQLDGSISHTGAVSNPDAIDIEMSDEEEEQDTAPLLKAPHTETEPDIASKTENNTHDQNSVSDSVQTTDVRTEHKDDGTISEDMRAKLAALSNTFVKAEHLEVSPSLPHPETITNKATKFLALSKCESGKQFLQLLEIEPYTCADEEISRPVKLRYDPEWLAILRVFASELELGGSPNNRIPQHRGDTYYYEGIVKEQDWILHNVVEKDLLDIPENFVQTVSQDEQPNNKQMPREGTNPQTSRFCALIGIENLFDISEEERDRRMAADTGPGHESERNNHHNGDRNRGSHRGGRRGRGRGRGRW